MEITHAAETRIANYRPTCLGAVDWDLAKAAVTDLVRRAAPQTSDQAKDMCTTLCLFLASPCGWDRVSEPDLDRLLNDPAIEGFADAQRTAGEKGRVRAALMRLQRAAAAVSPVPGSPAPRRHVKAIREVAAVHDGCLGTSFTVFASAFLEHTGKPLTEMRLRGLIYEQLANAPQPPVGTVPLGAGSLATYLNLTDHVLKEGITRTEAPKRSTATKYSHRQAQAQLKADRAAHRRATQGPRLAPDPGLDHLAANVREAVERYRPQDLHDAKWAELRPLTLRLVAGYRPPSVVAARNVATIAVAFLAWVWTLPTRPEPAAPPTAQELLTHPLHESYIRRQVDGNQPPPKASSAKERSVLRRCVRSLDADQVDVQVNHTPVIAPYTPAECQMFVAVALAQPTASAARNACYLFGLTLGAGLAPEDLRAVRRCDIVEQTLPSLGAVLTVRVGGKNPRTVPVRGLYEPLLRRALALSADLAGDDPVLGRKADRHNVTHGIRRGIVTARGPVDINTGRLRTTWLFAAMNANVPLRELLQMAGLRSARTLIDILPLCPAPSDDDVAAALAALHSAPDADLREEGQR